MAALGFDSLWQTAQQAPSLRSASKLPAQLVEPGCRSRRQLTPNKKPRLFAEAGFCVWYQWPD